MEIRGFRKSKEELRRLLELKRSNASGAVRNKKRYRRGGRVSRADRAEMESE